MKSLLMTFNGIFNQTLRAGIDDREEAACWGLVQAGAASCWCPGCYVI